MHLRHIDVENGPDLVQLVKQLIDAGEPLVLRRGNEDVAVVRQLKRRSRAHILRLRPFTGNDPIWNLQGIGRSGLSDVSENADRYLAEAYLDTHDGNDRP